MRSQVIFEAREKIGNRYSLCHAVARVTRRLHFSSLSTQDAISDAFVRVAHERCVAEERVEESATASREEVDFYFGNANLEPWFGASMVTHVGGEEARL